jgi:hypothetical protein
MTQITVAGHSTLSIDVERLGHHKMLGSNIFLGRSPRKFDTALPARVANLNTARRLVVTSRHELTERQGLKAVPEQPYDVETDTRRTTV